MGFRAVPEQQLYDAYVAGLYGGVEGSAADSIRVEVRKSVFWLEESHATRLVGTAVRFKVDRRPGLNQDGNHIYLTETGREVDFVALRRALAANTPWSDGLTEQIQPGARRQ